MNCIRKRINPARALLVGLFVICSADLSGGQRIAWTSRFSERPWSWDENLRDRALTVAVDASGNIYAGGVGFLRKYNSNGSELWKIQFASDTANALTVDALGNVYVAFQPSLLRKYDPNGIELWTQSGFVNELSDSDIAASSSGDIYVTSYRFGFEGAVRKHDVNGNLLWVRRFGAPRNLTGAPFVAVDAGGSIYVTATVLSQNIFGSYDVLVQKYDAGGTLIWTSEFSTPPDDIDFDSATAVAVDPSGSVYVVGKTTGVFPGQSAGLQGFVRKYNANGIELWTRQFGTLERLDVTPKGVATDTSGNIYIAGSTLSGTFPGQSKTSAINAYVIKYDASGSEQWTRQFGFGSQQVSANGIALDASGGIYVAGGTILNMDADAFVTKLVSCVSPPGDVNGDCLVDCQDLAAIKALFGKRPGQFGWHPPADLVADNVIDLRDLVFISQKLPVGTRCQ